MKYFSDENILKITEYLNSYKNRLYNYEWDTNVSKLEVILGESINLSNKMSAFERSLILKEILGQKDLINHRKFREIALWIVRDWGGIKTIKEANLFNRLDIFYKQNGQAKFDGISSLSKVIALNNPNQYVIYDSRVAYTMNWIILSQKAGGNFFPIPEGRNSKLKDFDIKTLIHLADTQKHKSQRSKIFIPKNETYYVFNELVCEINKILYPSKDPFYTEMLLFTLADKEIIDDITSRVHLHVSEKTN